MLCIFWLPIYLLSAHQDLVRIRASLVKDFRLCSQGNRKLLKVLSKRCVISRVGNRREGGKSDYRREYYSSPGKRHWQLRSGCCHCGWGLLVSRHLIIMTTKTSNPVEFTMHKSLHSFNSCL